MSEELKPCPFCSSKIKPMICEQDDQFGHFFWIRCAVSLCGGKTCQWDTKEQAIAAWNRRDREVVQDGIIEKLKSLVVACVSLAPEIPKGTQPHGQSMDICIRMDRFRKFHIALANTLALLYPKCGHGKPWINNDGRCIHPLFDDDGAAKGQCGYPEHMEPEKPVLRKRGLITQEQADKLIPMMESGMRRPDFRFNPGFSFHTSWNRDGGRPRPASTKADCIRAVVGALMGKSTCPADPQAQWLDKKLPGWRQAIGL